MTRASRRVGDGQLRLPVSFGCRRRALARAVRAATPASSSDAGSGNADGSGTVGICPMLNVRSVMSSEPPDRTSISREFVSDSSAFGTSMSCVPAPDANAPIRAPFR